MKVDIFINYNDLAFFIEFIKIKIEVVKIR